jgi:hypothetical protein
LAPRRNTTACNAPARYGPPLGSGLTADRHSFSTTSSRGALHLEGSHCCRLGLLRTNVALRADTKDSRAAGGAGLGAAGSASLDTFSFVPGSLMSLHKRPSKREQYSVDS